MTINDSFIQASARAVRNQNAAIEAQRRAQDLADQLRWKEATLQAVLDLHSPEITGSGRCKACLVRHPCGTVRLIEGTGP